MTEPPVDEYVQQAEERRLASQDLRRRVESIVATARDPEGLVEATTTAGGELKSLRLHPTALHRGVRWLGETITAVAQQAAEYAKQRGLNQLALVLGDEVTTQLEGAMGVAPARAAGWDVIGDRAAIPAPVYQQAVADQGTEDDVHSFDPSSLRSDR
ncbi:YbaB/EbfC family nucleoid-associated protein [Actinocrispum wychmicini]|uniref:YbaB/EbfC DNA-binding family protein n=1 Tax=Actinocrispum wychmicini TaxID=1213861 RepID=A0A4R2K6J3_9PSEU|nr:YbaB/EbfC family nucleoid-associated protein [Actinocrispum wychmicini]TCO65546.1 YbaB/EbfC DNA-binding family protein [Actinocrispum wychmicini]